MRKIALLGKFAYPELRLFTVADTKKPRGARLLYQVVVNPLCLRAYHHAIGAKFHHFDDRIYALTK